MPHYWTTRNDWEYCTLSNCKIVNDTVMLDNSLTGSIISDIRDSSPRIYDYAEIVPVINTPVGTSALLYVRSGWYKDYYEDSWTDWKLINEPEQRMEYTLSLTTNKIIANYNIKTLLNIYYYKFYKFRSLAGLTKEQVANNDIYSALWSSAVDEAIVDFAKVGYNKEALTIYAKDAATVDNVIVLKNPLPDDNIIVVIKYIPRYFVYSDMKNRYFQFKIELEIDPMYEGQAEPTLVSMTANYILDFQREMTLEFPKFFRRL